MAEAPTVGTPQSAKRTIVLAMLVGGGLAAGRQLVGGKEPQPRILVAALVAGVMLTAAAEVAPQPAAAFAVLMLGVAVVDSGPAVWAGLRSAEAPQPTSSTSPNGGGGGSSGGPPPTQPGYGT